MRSRPIRGGEGFGKTLKSHKFLKLYFYVYYMFIVSEFLTIHAVMRLKSLYQDVNIGQTGFTLMIVNVFLSRKRGREGVIKL